MVAKGIADVQSGKIKEIRDAIGMETNEFNPYRKRLIRKGIVSGEIRGYVSVSLYTSPSPRDISGSRMPSSA